VPVDVDDHKPVELLIKNVEDTTPVVVLDDSGVTVLSVVVGVGGVLEIVVVVEVVVVVVVVAIFVVIVVVAVVIVGVVEP
jgi:hypothetical protein